MAEITKEEELRLGQNTIILRFFFLFFLLKGCIFPVNTGFLFAGNSKSLEIIRNLSKIINLVKIRNFPSGDGGHDLFPSFVYSFLF